MKTINFTQEVEVIETYDIDYSQSDFEYDCEVFNIFATSAWVKSLSSLKSRILCA